MYILVLGQHSHQVARLRRDKIRKLSILYALFSIYYQERQKSFRPNVAPVHSDVPFSDKTTHNADYIKWPLPEKFRRSPEKYKPSSAEFDGQTTYAINYIPLKGERAEMTKPVYQGLNPNREFSVGFDPYN